ncbi:hypothetical protein JQ557_32120 [Bradyrhizobium sp. U87765 SZCCT0131]|uniref:DUF6968 family protein n=1 Tax=unclassified Bradyrhizobium TaxID=2631580 RepID=UPI001BA762C4|nr:MULTISPECIES: hypothetical protein [unclassified Bradyrhizobium]MBR1222685.1 hypothetical protein [Bradyrhizobium sp. U87765 SZCCT0131]MBR1265234.1 hypothetical protein [Bradyrhizobium sp. U87765 SZCCT0134]MBR1302987.1 hypothetical protein [Bradyrhizobium sp. U87765 SZCCT0110]MBR1323685.1 hypothetical protein [Bradyrhizobium sp. U87765 SZCCT0109]MBR1346916.1 hypothetical protein [Bradyrhizobium sp. U87765 SZCCT0048]
MTNAQTLIGTRELSLSDGGKVVVSLYQPVMFAPHEFGCAFEVSGLKRAEAGRAIGGDALQALQLALVRIGIELSKSDEGQQKRLMWNGDPDLGFPSPDSLR